jgi:hypothetical protein
MFVRFKTSKGSTNRSHTFSKVAAVALVLELCLRSGADSAPGEYQVKAAFIYNFTQFVEWPSDAFSSDGSPFVVAVIGDDPFKGILEQLMNDKQVGNRAIVIKHYSSADEIGRCQLLFIGANENEQLDAVLRKTAQNPVLTVGETDAMMSAGGGVHLYLDGGRMRFQINPEVLAGNRLKASAKLMKLARIYTR